MSVAKSVLSTRIAGLEGQLRTKLLHRSSRGVALTDAGQRFYERMPRPEDHPVTTGIRWYYAVQSLPFKDMGLMGKGRLEAFSDGVLAIIITIMVLELKVPHGESIAALAPVVPVFLSYVLSFIYVGIYWNNHHHMLHASKKISGQVLWANLHLLFWLSLLPFATGWMGENHFARLPSALYGVILLCAAIAYWLLQRAIIGVEGAGSMLAVAVGRDWKGKVSPVLYLAGVVSTAWRPWVAQAIYVLAALLWVVPDRRIEHVLSKGET